MTDFDFTKLFDREYLDTLPKITEKNPARVGDILIDPGASSGIADVVCVDAGDYTPGYEGYSILHREPMTWPSGSILVEDVGGQGNLSNYKGTRVPENVYPIAHTHRWCLSGSAIGVTDAKIEKMLAENPKLRVITPEEMK